MQLLWRKGALPAKDITEALNRQQESEVAHSTVQTLLRQLEQKGAVKHKEEGRTFSFYAVVDEQKTTKGVIRDFLSRLFHGSPAELAAHLVENEKLSREELKKLKELIEQKERQP